ncbi:MAG: ankyrin repeat domain-containing protein [Chitinophagaceae bacterium]
MKQFVFALFAFMSFAAQAQQNVFLDPSFWKNNPDLAMVKAEIEKGSDPAASNRMSFDAVVYAINAQANTAVIKFLLDQKGNDVNKLTHDGRTYLFWAANRGNLEIVEYLVSKGAKQNIEDTHGMTPISFAANGGQANTKVYDALIKAGADVKQKSPEGGSLLLLAIASDKDLTLTNYFISKGLSLKDVDAAGNTAFNYVARTGNIELMKTLLEKGVKYNDNAMIMATQGARGTANPIEVYQYLESLHIKATSVNSNGENVLHALARKPNQGTIIQYFLSRGANVNQPDNEGNTPFMNAASGNRDTATAALFLLQAKNINQVNKKGIAALAMAVRSNSPEVVQFLINKGADVNGYDGEGNNLAYYLIQSYNAQAAGRPAEAQGRAGGQKADGFETKMKILQAAGLNLSAPQKDGNTLYHLAVAKNDISLLKKIETLQVEVNAKNKEGLTPLQKAAMVAKDDSLLKYFLSIGAKKELTTEFKETAYDLAKENEFLTKNKVAVDFLK